MFISTFSPRSSEWHKWFTLLFFPHAQKNNNNIHKVDQVGQEQSSNSLCKYWSHSASWVAQWEKNSGFSTLNLVRLLGISRWLCSLEKGDGTCSPKNEHGELGGWIEGVPASKCPMSFSSVSQLYFLSGEAGLNRLVNSRALSSKQRWRQYVWPGNSCSQVTWSQEQGVTLVLAQTHPVPAEGMAGGLP